LLNLFVNNVESFITDTWCKFLSFIFILQFWEEVLLHLFPKLSDFRFAPDKQTSFTNILFNLFVNNVESLVESIFEFVEYNDNIEQ